MKAKYLCTAVAALAATLMCATGAYAKTAEMVNGSVFVEAEDGNLKTYCKVGESEDASGGKFVTFGEKASKVIEVPRLATDKAIEYEYNIDRKSNVHVWVRIRAWDWKANQVSVIVNNETLTGTATKLGEFEWIKLNATSRGTILNAGKHKLSIIPKTTGVEVDTVLITRKRATPTGINTVDDTLSMSFKDPRRFNLEDNGYSKETLADETYWDVSDIKPVNERPRVNLRKADIPKILENAKHPENQSAWEMHLRYVEDTSAKPTTEMIEAKALDYQLRGNKEAGEAAVREAVDFYEKNGAEYQKITGDAYNQIGLAVRTLAEVYDWCYDLLDEDEKEYIIDEMIMLMSQGNNQELQWPLYTQNLFTTHQAEGLLQNDVMAMAIAIYDERPDVYNFIAGRLFNEAVEYRKWVFSSYTYNQGLNYLDYRLKHEGMATFLIDKGLDVKNVYGDGFAKVPYRRIYMYRPDGFWFQDADSDSVPWNTQSKGEMTTWLVGNYYKDPYLRQVFLESKGCSFAYRTSIGNTAITTGQWLMFNDPTIGTRSERELPLTMYYPSPGGGMAARTGWDYGADSPTVAVDMKVKEYFVHGHDHMDSGSFQIYYKGLLARESGLYKSTNIGYNDGFNIGSSQFLSEHHTFFAQRSNSHNTIRVYDPDEEFWGDRNERTWKNSNQPYELDKIPNGGGQRQVALTYETDFETLKKEGEMGKVLAHEYGEDQIEPDFTYLKGDLAGAYSDKIDEYERSFMFLNQKNEEHPATLIVFDRVDTSNKTFKKTWQMYGTDQKPTINGTRTTISDKRTEQNGDLEYTGQLTVDTLMPAADNVEYNIVGGEGQWAVVDGVSYEAALPGSRDEYRNEFQNYRLEISPKKDNELDYFLNVLQVGEADGAEPYETQLIETDKLAGCVVGENVVVFGKRKDRTAEDTTFSFKGDGTFKITVADMQTGTWSAYRNGEYVGDCGVTEEGGVIFLRGQSGEYKFVYKNDTPKVYTAPTLQEQSRIMLYVNSRPAYMEEPAYINDDGKLMIPLRNVYEKIGAEVSWDAQTGSVVATMDGASLRFNEGEARARRIVDDTSYVVALSATVTMKNGVMMVPVDSVQYLTSGMTYTLNNVSQRLDVTYKKAVTAQSGFVDGTLLSESDTDKVYSLGDLVNVDEVMIKGEPGKTYAVEHSFDGENWTRKDGSITAIDGEFVSLYVGEWSGYIRIVTDGATLYDFKVLGYADELYDAVLNVEWSADNGSKETGLQAIDSNPNTLWSADGDYKYLVFDLGLKKEHEGMEVLWNKGDQRQTYFNVLGSDDKENWEYIIKDGVTDGKTADYEKAEFKNSSAYRYIKLEMFGTSTGTWNGIKEIRFLKDKE